MNLPEYKEKYKIKVINSPMYLGHSSIHKDDLIKFQAFLLATKDDTEEIKSESFQIDWKNFFVKNEKSVIRKQIQYFFKNLIIEKDPIKWGYKALFWGRKARRFKSNPEKIHSEKASLEMALIKNPDLSLQS